MRISALNAPYAGFVAQRSMILLIAAAACLASEAILIQAPTIRSCPDRHRRDGQELVDSGLTMSGANSACLGSNVVL